MASNRWYRDLSVVNWIFAIFGILVMAFSGGCSLMVLYIAGGLDSVFEVALIGGGPFLFGLIVLWMAIKLK